MRFKDCIDDFKQIMPLVEELANPALKMRHWTEIFKASFEHHSCISQYSDADECHSPSSLQMIEADIPLNEEGTAFTPFSVRMLLQSSILDKLEPLQTIGVVASKEFSLEKVLEKMRNDWEGVVFRITEYKDTGTYIMGGTDEVQVSEGCPGVIEIHSCILIMLLN